MGAPENPPAFPSQEIGTDGLPTSECLRGMTLRDWFAGQALVGILSGPAFQRADRRHDAMSAQAYYFADAMLTARQSQETPHEG